MADGHRVIIGINPAATILGTAATATPAALVKAQVVDFASFRAARMAEGAYTNARIPDGLHE